MDASRSPFAFRSQRRTQIGVCTGVFGIEIDSQLECRDGTLPIASRREDDPQGQMALACFGLSLIASLYAASAPGRSPLAFRTIPRFEVPCEIAVDSDRVPIRGLGTRQIAL